MEKAEGTAAEEEVCRYCNYKNEDVVVYHCKQCTEWVHAGCLESGEQSTVVYDNYFDFTCARCSITGKEVFSRQKLSTLVITYLTLQNLSLFSIGHDGYFEFHEHIIKYITKNWKSFYGKTNPSDDEVQKVCEKVRNVLSASSLFQNGKAVVKQKGWWCLTSMEVSPSYNPYKPPFIVMVRGKKTGIYKGHHRTSMGRGPRAEEIWVRKESEPAIDCFNNDMEMIMNSPEPLKNSKWARCLRDLHGLPPAKQSELALFREMEKVMQEDDESVVIDVETVSDETEKKKRPVVEAPEDVARLYGMAKMIGSDKVQLTETQDFVTDVDYYDNHKLKPFIKRTYRYRPHMYQVLNKIRERGGHPHLPEEMKAPKEPLHPLDFCYFGPRHLEAVNYLCGQFFWPGIDMLSCLSCPQLSVVAMYKKLVVGFAIMEPDSDPDAHYLSYFFVRPEWRGGRGENTTISNFMLYHLIHTSRRLNKTIRLHVSISNIAAYSLYKQFGFTSMKVEHNYYSKTNYFDQTMSPHAFYMEV